MLNWKVIFREDKLYYLLSFIMPIFTLGIAFAWFGIYPFGPKSILIQDLDQQYIQFYNYYYDVFHGGKSLFFSWQASLGQNFYGNFGYYLASIFSPLVLIFKRANLPEAILTLMLIKVGLAGLLTSIYLFKVYELKKGPLVAFSLMYALMTYVIGYMQNIMWLDGVAYFPLVLLGIENILRYNRYRLLLITLVLTFIANFYISYMIGIFSFLYFIAKYTLYYSWKDIRKVLSKFFQFIGTAILAAGISAVVIHPTYLALSETTNQPVKLFYAICMFFKLLDFYAMFFHGMDNSTMFSLPIIYIGLIPVLLAPIFFFLKEIPVKEKIVYGVLFIVLFFSLEVSFLNIIWHAFDIPNGFPFRYSFIISFLVLVMAVRVYLLLDKKNIKYLIGSYLLAIILVAILEKVSPKIMTDKKTIFNLVLLTLAVLLLYLQVYFHKHRNKLISFLLISFVSLELSSNGVLILKAQDQAKHFVPREVYAENSKEGNLIGNIKKRDRGFYRIEERDVDNINDTFRLNYQGIRHFSSMMNRNLARTLGDLGYTIYLEKWVCNNGATLLGDAIFGVKYLLSDKQVLKWGYSRLPLPNVDNRMVVYKNSNALAIGFMVDKVPSRIDYSPNEPFLKQNRVFNMMLNIPNSNWAKGNYQLFTQIIPEKVAYKNLKVINEKGALRLIKQSEIKPGEVVYLFKIRGNKQLYFLINADLTMKQLYHPESELFVNGRSLGVYPEVHNYRIIDLGKFNNNLAEVTLRINKNNYLLKNHEFYQMDYQGFQKGMKILKQQSFIVSSLGSRSLEGSIDVKRKGVLFLSIPYQGGWRIFVNGKRVEPSVVLGSFIGIPLDKGPKTIKMDYISPGFRTGWVITSISILIVILLYLRELRRKYKNLELS